MAMLRVASSKVVPNAIRAIASPRILLGFITNAENSQVKRESPFVSHQYFSTDAKNSLDRKFAKILKSEIKSKQLSLETSMPTVPADFPFTIQDDPCEREITLTREFDREKIDVVVYPAPRNISQDDEEESDSSGTDASDDDNSDDNGGDGGGDDDGSSTDHSNSDEETEKSAPSVGLNVKISKENGKKLNFGVCASSDEIKIGTLSVKEPASESDELICFGEYVVDEDSDLEFALREYLEMRGIKKSYVNFLYEYMVRKSKQHPLLVLKKLRKFIKE